MQRRDLMCDYGMKYWAYTALMLWNTCKRREAGESRRGVRETCGAVMEERNSQEPHSNDCCRPRVGGFPRQKQELHIYKYNISSNSARNAKVLLWNLVTFALLWRSCWIYLCFYLGKLNWSRSHETARVKHKRTPSFSGDSKTAGIFRSTADQQGCIF